jgi:hypothetical protein
MGADRSKVEVALHEIPATPLPMSAVPSLRISVYLCVFSALNHLHRYT